jgi:hypothetical protein
LVKRFWSPFLPYRLLESLETLEKYYGILPVISRCGAELIEDDLFLGTGGMLIPFMDSLRILSFGSRTHGEPPYKKQVFGNI